MIENTLPWAQQGSQNKATSGDTTPGGPEPVRWVALGVNFSPAEAAIIKGRLESQGIPAVVQQEAVGVVFGLTVGPLGSARVLVPQPLADQARALLAETFETEAEAGFEDPDPEDEG